MRLTRRSVAVPDGMPPFGICGTCRHATIARGRGREHFAQTIDRLMCTIRYTILCVTGDEPQCFVHDPFEHSVCPCVLTLC